jgi:hypothetical protein
MSRDVCQPSDAMSRISDLGTDETHAFDFIWRYKQFVVQYQAVFSPLQSITVNDALR